MQRRFIYFAYKLYGWFKQNFGTVQILYAWHESWKYFLLTKYFFFVTFTFFFLILEAQRVWNEMKKKTATIFIGMTTHRKEEGNEMLSRHFRCIFHMLKNEFKK